MRIPKIHGIIKRRFLLNYRADKKVVQRLLPDGFQPKLQQNMAIVGICLIRLEEIRPNRLPKLVGFSSENAAHRIAVKSDRDGKNRECVYIPRRDTNSALTSLAGGRIFPGRHFKARFDIERSGNRYSFSMKSLDNSVTIEFKGQRTRSLPRTSIFGSLGEASKFFENGSLGFSPSYRNSEFDGVILEIDKWKAQAFEVTSVTSSYFDDRISFPKGSIEFDHALIMENLAHSWKSAPNA